MKMCQYAIILVLSSICGRSAWFGRTPYAVSRFEHLPRSYTKKLKNNLIRRSSTLKTKEKDRICNEVFKVIEGNAPIDPTAHQDMLKSKHRELYDEIFEKRCTPRFGMQRKDCIEADKTFQYVNASKPITLIIYRSEHYEKAFVCLFFTGQGDDLRRYYVSDNAYNVNDSNQGPEMLGRIILYNGKVYALAERLPKVSYTREANSATRMTLAEVYWYRRSAYGQQKGTISKSTTDPICKLDEGKRPRLCTFAHMLNSNIIPHEWQQDSISVQPELCERRTILLTNGAELDEWMIVCDYHSSSGLKRSLHVSRGYKNNSVFVSTVDAEEKLDFLYLLDRVSVVVDGK